MSHVKEVPSSVGDLSVVHIIPGSTAAPVLSSGGRALQTELIRQLNHPGASHDLCIPGLCRLCLSVWRAQAPLQKTFVDQGKIGDVKAVVLCYRDQWAGIT